MSNIIKKLGMTSRPWEHNINFHVQANSLDRRQEKAKHICVALSDFHSTIADFDLIAAAPEMLEALIGEALQAESEWGVPQTETQDAIEKATGRTWTELKELINE